MWRVVGLVVVAVALLAGSYSVVGVGDDERSSISTAERSKPPGPPRILDVRPDPSEEAATPTPKAKSKKVVVPAAGSGSFGVADGGTELVGVGRAIVYQVEVEEEVSIDPADFARSVDATLADERGWTKGGAYAVQRTPNAPLRIVLATPTTTDRLCAPLLTRGEVSCQNGNVVVINAVRWVDGAQSYAGDLRRYRQYVVNHEFGHSLGFGHRACPRAGDLAPVMLQQTRSLQGCIANPWP